jgi:hypothetical protein
LKKLDNLAAIIEDVEDLMAERMELALLGGWTDWSEYKVQSKHKGLFGSTVEVRFRYPNTAMVEVEVRREKTNGWDYMEVELDLWFFPGLEREDDARSRREVAPKKLRPY